MSSEDGDVVDKVMVVEIKSFAVVRCICELRLHIYTSETRTLERSDASRCQRHRWSLSRSFRSSIHPQYLPAHQFLRRT